MRAKLKDVAKYLLKESQIQEMDDKLESLNV